MHIFGASPIVVRFDVDFVELNGIGLVTTINFLFVREAFVDRFLTWTTTTASSASPTDHCRLPQARVEYLHSHAFYLCQPLFNWFSYSGVQKLEIDWAYRRSFAMLLEFNDSDMDQFALMAQWQRKEFDVWIPSGDWERLQDHGGGCDVPRLDRQHKIAGVDMGFIIETTIR
ncbi:hypothetical protein EDD85DRAFT_962847 [Armillaria nabsnona]|nr:hypothetical protein EDD85DRAFT_962847 [Armillaria nabsnona]